MQYKNKIFISVGEISGDQIASLIMKELIENHKIELQGIGGNNLKKLGLKSLFPLKEISIMGLLEVIPKIPKLISLISLTVNKILLFKPDIIITVDAPGFNFRVLKKIKKYNLNTKIIHIVAPTVWAWKSGRAKKISSLINHLFVLYPFEKKFFTPHGLKTYFIGHPLLEDTNNNLSKSKKQMLFNNKKKKKSISIFPGSRKNEIEYHLSLILLTIKNINDLEKFNIIIVAVEDHISLIKDIVIKSNISNDVHVISNIYKLLVFKNSFFSIAVSGTITLELALHKVPFFTVYKLNFLSFFILKRLVKSEFITLVNIIYSKKIVQELIQKDFNEVNIKKNILLLLNNKSTYNYQLKQFSKLSSLLSNKGKAPSKYAASIIKRLLD
jgi:lipid-A-disaccharide synthase